LEVVGWPVQAPLRGELVDEDGRVVGEPGRGRVADGSATDQRSIYP
jgi:hypothetical protein